MGSVRLPRVYWVVVEDVVDGVDLERALVEGSVTNYFGFFQMIRVWDKVITSEPDLMRMFLFPVGTCRFPSNYKFV